MKLLLLSLPAGEKVGESRSVEGGVRGRSGLSDGQLTLSRGVSWVGRAEGRDENVKEFSGGPF